jgi:hypothetical protein
VFEQIVGGSSQKLFPGHPVLRQHGVVHLGDALVCEDVIEGFLLVDGSVPLDRLVEHHEEEAVERL